MSDHTQTRLECLRAASLFMTPPAKGSDGLATRPTADDVVRTARKYYEWVVAEQQFKQTTSIVFSLIVMAMVAVVVVFIVAIAASH